MLLCAHPSREGLRSGDGSGGSTAWNNAVRSRLYLRREGEEGDLNADFRVLEVKKANLARTGISISIMWQAGVFVRDGGGTRQPPLSEDEEGVIDEVEHAFNQRHPRSAHPQAGHRWLGQWIKKTRKKTRKAAKSIVDRLLARGRVVEIDYDLHRHRSGLCTQDQAKNLRAKEPR